MPTTIAIIGAGCAGLGAAATLVEQSDVDVRVILIEATGRIGGRAWTSTDPNDLPVDMGPQFIQDPDVNPWKQIALETLDYNPDDLVQPSMDPWYRINEGGVWSDVFMNDGIKAANAMLDGEYRRACGYANAPILTGNAPALCDGQQDLRLALGSNGLGPIAESAEPWQYVASDLERQADEDAGENIYVKTGLGTLVAGYGDWLLSRYGLRLNFVPNVPIDKIDDTNPAAVRLHAGDNETASVDFCIVTIPCGELKSIIFKPPLPGDVERAAGLVRLGSYKKVAFRPTSFPPPPEGADEDEDSALKQDCDYYIYKAPARENDDPDQPYRPDTGGTWQYFRLPTDPTILICVTAGDFARRLDDLPDDQVSASVIDLLSAAYPGGDFPPQRSEVVVTNWTHQPYVHGAYSYTWYDERLGADNPFPLDARALIAKPHGRVHFAGEATWIPAYGTIQGAYWSGDRAAREILEILRAAH
jgi:hypothetical protein